MNIKEKFEVYKRKRLIDYLKSVKPERLTRLSEQSLLKAFKKAARRVPAYNAILKNKKIDYRKIKNIRDFKQYIPFFDKNSIFPHFSIHELCLKGSINSLKSILSSSGFSGVYSFGINTRKNYKSISKSIDTSLEYLFQISKKNTLMLNCIPMGVKVHTSIPLAETSVRSDIALAIIKKFSDYYDQIVIVGDPYFIKKIAEEGLEQNIDWEKFNASFVFGEDWFSESFHAYIEKITNINTNSNEGRKVISTMGIAELDLNLFHDSVYSVQIRKYAQRNDKFKKELFGAEGAACPVLFHYFPHRTYMETNNLGELVFSMLSPNLLIPLIRYNSKDLGKVILYNEMERILIKYHLESLIPDIKLPFVSVGGRSESNIVYKDTRICLEDIKQGLFENFEVAKSTTGYFRLSYVKDPIIEVQLKKGISLTKNLVELFSEFANKYLSVSLPVKLYVYEKFPYSMGLDYESKFKFI